MNRLFSNIPPRLWIAAAAALFAFTLLKNAWMADDVFIGMRMIEQIAAGNGMRWNPHERIYLFSSVIGFFSMVLARVFTADPFWIYGAGAVVFNTLVLFLLYRIFPNARQWCAAVLLLLASKSYMDFSWSGMHNFVGHAMLAAFILLWAKLFDEGKAERKTVLALFALGGLAPLFRHDFSLFLWIPCAYAFWHMQRRMPAKTLAAAAALLLTPIFLWTLFAIFYFGFPLPMTAYIKLGAENITRDIWINFGLHYYLWALTKDAIILPCIAAALFLLIKSGKRHLQAVAAAMAAHLFYILYSGADYMGGRFFTYAYFLSVIVLVRQWGASSCAPANEASGDKSDRQQNIRADRPRAPRWLPAAALAWSAFYPNAPLNAPFLYPSSPLYKGVISDERGNYHDGSRLSDYIAYRRGEAPYYPDNKQMKLGEIIARSSLPVFHICNMGMSPYNARLEQKFIDIYGFSDPLQAFLPAIRARPGHLMRALPAGYLRSVAANDAVIEDARYNDYYKKLRLVTQSDDLFALERLAAIITLNTGGRPPAPKYDENRFQPYIHPILCEALHSLYSSDFLRNLEQTIERVTYEAINQSSLSE